MYKCSGKTWGCQDKPGILLERDPEVAGGKAAELLAINEERKLMTEMGSGT